MQCSKWPAARDDGPWGEASWRHSKGGRALASREGHRRATFPHHAEVLRTAAGGRAAAGSPQPSVLAQGWADRTGLSPHAVLVLRVRWPVG